MNSCIECLLNRVRAAKVVVKKGQVINWSISRFTSHLSECMCLCVCFIAPHWYAMTLSFESFLCQAHTYSRRKLKATFPSRSYFVRMEQHKHYTRKKIWNVEMFIPKSNISNRVLYVIPSLSHNTSCSCNIDHKPHEFQVFKFR